MTTLKGKVALVTGSGGNGIGAATAYELAARGAQVIVNYRSNYQSAQAVVDAIEAVGGQALAIQADVLDRKQVAQMITKTIEVYGRLDILVNSKGGHASDKLPGKWGGHNFEDLSWEELAERINGEIIAAFNITKAVVPIMQLQHYGRLVFVSSEHSQGPIAPGMIANGTAKGALNTFVVFLAHELGPLGITANIVSPGMVLNERTIHFVPSEIRERVAAVTPLGRAAKPEDIARAIVFFASDDSAFMTGVYAPVTGGARYHF